MEEINIILTIAVSIATIVAGISAWIQYRINRYRLKVELYDRIKKIFDSTEKLFTKIVANYSLNFNEAIDFRQETSEARFILKGKTLKHVAELRSKAMLLAQACSQLEALKNTDRDISHLVHKKKELIDWFHDQPEITGKVFKKYLDIRK